MNDQSHAEESSMLVVPRENGEYGEPPSPVAPSIALRLLMLVGLVASGVLVARWLGPGGFGTIATLNALMAFALLISSPGLPSLTPFFISGDRRKLRPVWANATMYGFIVGTLFVGLMFVFWQLRPTFFGGLPVNLIVIAGVSIPFQLLILLGLNALLGMGRIELLTLLDGWLPVLTLVSALIVLFGFHGDLRTLVSLMTAAAIVISVVMLLAVGWLVRSQKDRQIEDLNAGLMSGMLGHGLRFTVPVIAPVLIFRIDLLVLAHYRGVSEAGVYAVASQVANVLTVLLGMIVTLFFARANTPADESDEPVAPVARYATIAMVILCLLAAGASFLLPAIYGAPFVAAKTQFWILLPGLFLVGVQSVWTQQFSNTGLPSTIPIFWLLTLAINLALNVALVQWRGGSGAALASSVSYLVVFILVAIYFRAAARRRRRELFPMRGDDLLSALRPSSPTNAHL